ncbi:MAG TPA: hypothetical protein VFQ54_08615 [Thermomicrobiales bacterium]|nr:hypothetical protein [Thermomicrobiales bacterium]
MAIKDRVEAAASLAEFRRAAAQYLAASDVENVGIREFRDHATRYFASSKPVAISRHGKIVGFYVPVERDKEDMKRALDDLGRTVEAILERTGMTEDEFADLFDLNKPLPPEYEDDGR